MITKASTNINETISYLNKYFKNKFTGLKIGVWGLAFKPNIDDLRESPAKFIIQKVIQNSNNNDYFIVEPNIKSHSIYKLTDYKDDFEELNTKFDKLPMILKHDCPSELDIPPK